MKSPCYHCKNQKEDKSKCCLSCSELEEYQNEIDMEYDSCVSHQAINCSENYYSVFLDKNILDKIFREEDNKHAFNTYSF